MISIEEQKLLNLENVSDEVLYAATSLYTLINFIRVKGNGGYGFPEGEDMEKTIMDLESLREKMFRLVSYFEGKYDIFRANQDTRRKLLEEKENG